MKLSQLIHAMDRDETIIVNTCRDVPLPTKNLYTGTVRGIHKDSPLNKGHVKFLMAMDNSILVEIFLKEGENNEQR